MNGLEPAAIVMNFIEASDKPTQPPEELQFC